MKKLLVCIMAFALTLPTIAQEEPISKNFHIGAKAGINFATITGDDPAIQGRTSFHLGGMAEIPISEKLSAQPELLFSSQGAKYENEGSLHLNYLYVPLMGKYYVTDQLSLEVGPQFGYLVSARAKYDTIDTLPSPNTTGNKSGANESEDVKSDVKSLDAGINFGLGYKLDSAINFSIRYSVGLLNGNNLDDDLGKFKNSVIQISVGYFFF